jgi:hypothetical protein
MTAAQRILLALLLSLPLPSMACAELVPSHPQVVAAAQTIFEGVVVSRRPAIGRKPTEDDKALVLLVRVTERIKGYTGPYAFIETAFCTVPAFLPGSRVTAIRFPGETYQLVRTRDGR